MLNNYALIIGVEDYSAYDLSVNLPAGTNNATGALNDAKVFYRQCRAMGFSPERIRVLTSPRLTPADLGPGAIASMIGDATHDAIVAGITELTTEVSNLPFAAGLLAFSGHGLGSNGAVLCPSDLTSTLAEVVDVSKVRALISGPDDADKLTLVLDCCRTRVGDTADTSLKGRLNKKHADLVADRVRRGEPTPKERTIAACSNDQIAESSKFGAVQMGAFTWAITSAMSQWKMSVEKDVARLDVSYGELTSRTKALLSALSFEQDPTLSGPAAIDALPFLHPGSAVHWGETSREPNAVRGKLQLDGGQYNLKYLTPDRVWKTFANIYVAGGTETWTVCVDLVAGLWTAKQLKMSQGLGTLSSTNTVVQSASASTDWPSASNPTYESGADYVTYSPASANYTYDAAGNSGALCATFQKQTVSGGYDFVKVKWYNPTNANITMTYESDGVISWGAPGTQSSYSGNCYVASSVF